MVADVGDRTGPKYNYEKYSSFMEEEGRVHTQPNPHKLIDMVADVGDREYSDVKYSTYMEEEGMVHPDVPHAEKKLTCAVPRMNGDHAGEAEMGVADMDDRMPYTT